MEMCSIQIDARQQNPGMAVSLDRSVISGQWSRWAMMMAVLLMLYLPIGVSAQGSTSAQQPELPRDIEEMVITGGSSLQQIRAQMLAEQRRVYETFNAFNDEDRFNVSCRLQAPTGTRFREQLCLPEFVREATRDHARYYWETYRAFLDPYTDAENVYYSHSPMQTQIASQQEAFREKMREVARENPEFVETLVRYSQLAEQYRAAGGRDAD